MQRAKVLAEQVASQPPKPSSFREWISDKYVSPYDLVECPCDVILLYNPSLHANNVAVEDLLRVWKNLIIVQTVQEGRRPVVGVTHYFNIPKGTWGNMPVFNQYWREFLLQNRWAREKKIGFYPIWSSMAEDSAIARKAIEYGFHWIGAKPVAMDGLGKVEYKKFCAQFNLSTAPFFELSVQEQDIETACTKMCEVYATKVKGSPLDGKPFFVKSEYGGGGRGTKKAKPTAESVSTAIRAVVAETGKLSGIYAELALDLSGATLYQIEMEADAGEVVDGGRLVYFNKRNQKMIELGYSSEEIVKYLPAHVYGECVRCAQIVARESKYDGRGTNEILIVRTAAGEWELYNSEFNKRVQVEHKALSNLKRYHTGQFFNTIADQVMRSCGYPPPDYKKDLLPSGCGAVGHVRLIAPQISYKGEVSFPVGVCVEGLILPKGFTATMDVGQLYSDTDAQFGCAIVNGTDWHQLLLSLQRFAHETVILGKNIKRDFFHFLRKFFHDARVYNLTLGCNQTFDVLKNQATEDGRLARVVDYLNGSASRILVNGWRDHDGVPNRPYPTDKQIKHYLEMRGEIAKLPVVRSTPFLRYLHHLDEDTYFMELRKLIVKQGGAMICVFPRDVQQECGGSESHLITIAARQLIERIGPNVGYIGYEIGGAQFQTAEMNQISSTTLLQESLLANLATHSLTRSQWMNGLEVLTADEIRYILSVTANLVRKRFHLPASCKKVPYFPYNFHAGNVEEQDEVTALMLEAGMTPIPSFCWDPRFTIADFETWMRRQLDIWKRAGRTLHQIRIKNAGQQKEWTTDNVVKYVTTIRRIYKENYGKVAEPIINIHNHNFNGLASHVAFEALKRCQEDGYRLLVVDTAPPAMTHNNNLIVSKALILSEDQRQKLIQFDEVATSIWHLTCRFHDFPLVGTDPDTIWAGGTGSSDQIAARKVGIALTDVEPAKVLGAKVTGLAAIVTPYSQWSMVTGYTCYKQGLRTFDAVLAHINNGGTLNLPKNILVGLDDWRTMLAKPPHVAKLIANHKAKDSSVFKKDERRRVLDIEAIRQKIMEAAPNQATTECDIARVIAFGNFALKTMELEDQGQDHNWLLDFPSIAYAKKVPVGVEFTIHGVPVHYVGIEDVPDSTDSVITFRFEGQWVRVRQRDNAKAAKFSQLVTSSVPTADPQNPNHVGAFMPGMVEAVHVKIGQVIATGDALYSINSMKMVTAFKAAEAHNGKVVERICVAKGDELAYTHGGAPPLVLVLGSKK